MNGFFAVAMYFGFFQEVEAAENLAIWIAWLTIVLTLFLTNDGVIEEIKKKGRSAPKWANISFDICATATLMYGGWWVTAFFYMIHTVIQEEVLKKALEE